MPPSRRDHQIRVWPLASYRASALLIAILAIVLPLVALLWSSDWTISNRFEVWIGAQVISLILAAVLLSTLLRPVDQTAAVLSRFARGESSELPLAGEHSTSVQLLEGASLLIEQHRTQRERLETEQAEDHTTGLYNRRWTEVRLAEDLSRARRGHASLTVALLRIVEPPRRASLDGSLTRQLLLQNVAKLVRGNTRVGDWSGHWDAHKLVLVLWEDDDKATMILERIEAASAAVRIVASGSPRPTALRIAATKYNRRDTPKALLSKLSDALDHWDSGAGGVRLLDSQSGPSETTAVAANRAS